MTKWYNRPKITPLQLLLIFGFFIYFEYLNTEIFNDLIDLFKILIYAGGLLLSALAGYSAIDAKKLGRLVKKIMRQKNGKTYEERWNECVEVIDEALFDLGRIKKKKNKKGGKK